MSSRSLSLVLAAFAFLGRTLAEESFSSLAADDECQQDDDGRCALSAVQLRGALEEQVPGEREQADTAEDGEDREEEEAQAHNKSKQGKGASHKTGKGTLAVCMKSKQGPKCSSDGDCAGKSGCSRCAKSGFCSHLKLEHKSGKGKEHAHAICVSGKKGPKCGSVADCAGKSGCQRCAASGFCTASHAAPAKSEGKK